MAGLFVWMARMTREGFALPVDIVTFAMSDKYLGKDYLSAAQRAILKAIYGDPMERDERLAFLELTEGREPRKGGYDEAAIICGVRSGKTELGTTVLTYECVGWNPVLASILPPGKTAKGIIVAQNERGAGEAREYVEGNLLKLHDAYGGILASVSGQERAITGKSIKLSGACEIVIYPSKKASVRAATGLCFIGDEVAYWEVAEGAYSQDTKVMRAVRSRFATLSRLHPKRLLISSPDEEEGVLYEAWKHRETRPKVLVINAPSWALNPSLEQSFLDDEEEKDPEDFKTEYGAQFRRAGGGNAFLSADVIEQCIERGRIQNPPKSGIEYLAWMDAAFKRDRFSLGIGHLEYVAGAPKVVVDHTRHWTPRATAKGRKAAPLDDREVIKEVVAEIRAYGCDRIHGDQFADVPIKNTFQTDHGVLFVESPVSAPEKVDAFKNLRASMRARLVSIPEDPVLVKDLKSLEVTHSKTAGSMMVRIAAPKRKGAYDDAANVLARIVSRLLPIGGKVDLAAINARGAPSRNSHGLDWRQPPKEDEFHGRLMEAIY